MSRRIPAEIRGDVIRVKLESLRRAGLAFMTYDEVGRTLLITRKTVRNKMAQYRLPRFHSRLGRSPRRRALVPWETMIYLAQLVHGQGVASCFGEATTPVPPIPRIKGARFFEDEL